jgi:hypothetical protein
MISIAPWSSVLAVVITRISNSTRTVTNTKRMRRDFILKPPHKRSVKDAGDAYEGTTKEG